MLVVEGNGQRTTGAIEVAVTVEGTMPIQVQALERRRERLVEGTVNI